MGNGAAHATRLLNNQLPSVHDARGGEDGNLTLALLLIVEDGERAFA
jgi:hypothetical protein